MNFDFVITMNDEHYGIASFIHWFSVSESWLAAPKAFGVADKINS